jgi:hypothetical protein
MLRSTILPGSDQSLLLLLCPHYEVNRHGDLVRKFDRGDRHENHHEYPRYSIRLGCHVDAMPIYGYLRRLGRYQRRVG